MTIPRLVPGLCALMLAVAGPAAGQERKPGDLVDVESIRDLTLTDLQWEEDSRQEIDGVLVLSGTWRGPWYSGSNSSGVPAPGYLSERAKVWIPLREPANSEVAQIVWAAHVDQNLQIEFETIPELLARVPVAILRHGQRSEDWTSRGFPSRDNWMNRSLDYDVVVRNLCELIDYRSNYGVSLVETQLMAVTLLSRLLSAEGYVPGPAAMRGLSKEGFSTWFSAAVDERIVVANPGGYHLEDFVAAYSRREANGRCGRDINGLSWFDTEGGRAFLQYFSVREFATELKPEFLLIYGDVGMHGMHDGIYFSTGEETHFLENFSAVPFRYDRVDPGDANDYRRRHLAFLAHYLVTGDTASYPKVVESSVEKDQAGTSFRASARVDPEPDDVRLWWSYSDNRAFNDQGNAPWVSVDMILEGDDWVSPWVTPPAGMMIGWYVVAESSLEWERLSLTQRDASPQRFFDEFPSSTCPHEPPDCPPCDTHCLGLRLDLVREPEVRVRATALAEDDTGDVIRYLFEAHDGGGKVGAVGPQESNVAEFDLPPGGYTISVSVSDDSNCGPAADDARREEPITVPAGPFFLRGDCDGSGQLEGSVNDAIANFQHCFSGREVPCRAACDVDGDGNPCTGVTDGLRILLYVFRSGDALTAPFPDCGVSELGSDADLGCIQSGCE